MVLIPPGHFQRGAGEDHTQFRIDHRLAFAAREVTIAEFRRFRRDYTYTNNFARTDDCPVHDVSWYDAVAYCNWLSEQDGIPKGQWCYLPNEHGQYAEGMKVAPDFLMRSGYRLPTAVEWEYGCRAGSVTRWSIGEAEELLTKYAWCVSNAWSRLHPVGDAPAQRIRSLRHARQRLGVVPGRGRQRGCRQAVRAGEFRHQRPPPGRTGRRLRARPADRAEHKSNRDAADGARRRPGLSAGSNGPLSGRVDFRRRDSRS